MDHKVGLKESSVLSELVGCMAHETPSRQACLQNQGSIHSGIVLNPAGSCAVRHEPYGVLDFRVAIDSLPCDKVAGFGRMLVCLSFLGTFEAVLQTSTATVQRGLV